MVGLYPRLVWQLLTLCILNPSWVHTPPKQLYPLLKAYNLKQCQIMFNLTIHLTCYHSETNRTCRIKIRIQWQGDIYGTAPVQILPCHLPIWECTFYKQEEMYSKENVIGAWPSPYSLSETCILHSFHFLSTGVEI